MRRREFLKTGLALTGAMSVGQKAMSDIVVGIQESEPKMKIGILSDVHIRYSNQTGALQKSLEYFRDNEVDGVMIAGDIADAGLLRQLKWVAQTWYKVFPKNATKTGHHVEKLFIYGNHDMYGARYGSITDIVPSYEVEHVIANEALDNNPAVFWKSVFRENFSQIYMKDICGYKFVGAHWDSQAGTPGLAEFLEAHRSELEGDKPFFFFQHPHPKDTCYGDWAWGMDNGDSTKALSKFPNCIAFSGHSHTILNDERSIWQGAFTSIGTSSLSYTYTLGGRENTYIDGDKTTPPYQMALPSQTDGKQGMLMTVYKDFIRLERLEFVYNEKLGDDWIIPLPFASGAAPFSYSLREDKSPVPQFPAGSKVKITRAKGKDRYGTEQLQTTVHFPNVLKKTAGTRAFDFEVQLEIQEMDVIRVMLTKRVMSPGFYLGEVKDSGEAICIFGEKEIPAYRRYRFVVRPCNCFSKKGDAIYSDWKNS